jgi:hypothetical protein
MYQLLFFSKINCEGTWNCIFLVRNYMFLCMSRVAHSFWVDYIDVKSSSKILQMGFLARRRWKLFPLRLSTSKEIHRYSPGSSNKDEAGTCS